MLSVDDKNKIIDKAYKLLQDNKIYSEIWCDSNLPVIFIQIDNGDWKHEHLFAKSLLEENNFHFIGSQEIGDSQEDTYSAIHRFICSSVEV